MSGNPASQRLAAKVRQLRVSQHLSMTELADKAQVPLTTVSRIESGRVSSISVDTLVAFAKALGESYDNLLSEVACLVCVDAPPHGFICGTCGAGEGRFTVGHRLAP